MPKTLYLQVAALPYTIINNEIMICLITSRETGRWVLPKGWPKTDKENHLMAKIEAEEEAGLRGKISKKCLATYTYKKKLHIFATVTCEVEIYPFHVTHQNLRWPEESQRQLLWTSLDDAQSLIEESELVTLLTKITPDKAETSGLTLAP